MKQIIKYAVIVCLAVFFIFFTAYLRAISQPVNPNGEDVIFTVAEGEGVKLIGLNLVDSGLINSKFWFEFYIWRTKNEKKIQAGEYILNPRYSIKKITSILVGGEAISQERTIKIIEGWRIVDMANYFEKQGMFSAEELLKLAGYPRVDYRVNREISNPRDYSSDFDFLADKPVYYGLEGYLFPDTYRVFKDSTLDDIARKMLANFGVKLSEEMRAEIKKQGKSIFEVVTMASLLEKEVRSEEDMKIASGIFWNRIKAGQPLESCATLAYILEQNKPQYSLEDTKIDSPYNTYLILGLPPGPISNPGLKAIRAAIYPKDTDYNYFLNRPDTGETVFSRTYEEHLRNKAKHL